MSTRPRYGGARDTEDDNTTDATQLGSKVNGSGGKSKHSLKKKKKWVALDLYVDDNASEAGSASVPDLDVGHTRAPSPTTSVLTSSDPPSENNADSIADTPLDKDTAKTTEEVTFIDPSYNLLDKVGGPTIDYNTYVDDDPTPTQARFNGSALPSIDGFSDALDLVDSDHSDTQSTKDRTEAAMENINLSIGSKKAMSFSAMDLGGDGFDSVEWDPDLPSGPNDSPEPVTVKPQPVAYTTVGSLVNPNDAPRFQAPNRLGREGAGPRPLSLAMMQQTSPYDNYYPPRMPVPLSKQSSMQYAQQIAQTPVRLNQPPTTTSANSSHSARPIMPPLTQQEHAVLNITTKLPQMLTGNGLAVPTLLKSHRNLSPSSADSAQRVPNPNELLAAEGLGQSNAVRGLGYGPEKMQTLRNLANFDNPSRDYARSRLSAFSVSKSENGEKVANNTSVISVETMLGNSLSGSNGDLDRGYQFPPPGLSTSSAMPAQANPLHAAYNTSTLLSSSAPSRPPGYPQPLTAGPPGQRQYNGVSSRTAAGYPIIANPRIANSADNNSSLSSATTPGIPDNTSSSSSGFDYVESFWGTSSDPSREHPRFFDPSSQSPWNQRIQTRAQQQVHPTLAWPYPVAVAPVNAGPQTPLVDTLSIEDMSKYYPHGLPSDVTGQYKPLSVENQQKMGLIPDDEPLSAEEKQKKRLKELDAWFYGGMNAFTEAQKSPLTRPTNQFGPIAPPKKSDGTAETKKITAEEMEMMSVSDAAAPLVNSVLRNLESYADKKSPDSNFNRSGWSTPPPWQIDDSKQGNKSLFGEDWGKPPKRFGRDSRYQT
jgi:hypothetical protein